MKGKRKKSKKIINLVAICSFCAILLSAATYAWFIGMKTVSVDKFDVEIATTEGLFLSMDGKNWSYELDAKNALAYTNNANQWLSEEPNGKGLIPMSSIGEMDSTSSRMKLYQKGSLTSVTNGGGYRLLSKQVDNYTNKNITSNEYIEGDGYIAFDLFIKNLSGDEYYTDNNKLNEEAIYLTTNSAVTVGSLGKENTGIENSIRVGFVQLGRVNAELELEPDSEKSNQDIITGITCANVGSDLTKQYVTGICRDASIWEPNDTKHTLNALKWFSKGCLNRGSVNKDAEDTTNYTSTCLANPNDALTTYYNTYAVAKDIPQASPNTVNAYDGLNGYNGSITDGYLKQMDYFTDSEKVLTGTARQQFMSLAPNSITKLRVYIWLEGQDIDNYDYAQLGKQVKINFGFTKERFTETDVNYDGPSTDITNHTVMYDAKDGVVELTGDAIGVITYNASSKSFTIPNDYVKDFTFTLDGVSKTATHSVNEAGKHVWSIAE